MTMVKYSPTVLESAYAWYLSQNLQVHWFNFRLSGRQAVPFLSQSGLDRSLLRNFWSFVDPQNEGSLDLQQFQIILRLVALAQNMQVQPDFDLWLSQTSHLDSIPLANFGVACPHPHQIVQAYYNFTQTQQQQRGQEGIFEPHKLEMRASPVENVISINESALPASRVEVEEPSGWAALDMLTTVEDAPLPDLNTMTSSLDDNDFPFESQNGTVVVNTSSNILSATTSIDPRGENLSIEDTEPKEDQTVDMTNGVTMRDFTSNVIQYSAPFTGEVVNQLNCHEGKESSGALVGDRSKELSDDQMKVEPVGWDALDALAVIPDAPLPSLDSMEKTSEIIPEFAETEKTETSDPVFRDFLGTTSVITTPSASDTGIFGEQTPSFDNTVFPIPTNLGDDFGEFVSNDLYATVDLVGSVEANHILNDTSPNLHPPGSSGSLGGLVEDPIVSIVPRPVPSKEAADVFGGIGMERTSVDNTAEECSPCFGEAIPKRLDKSIEKFHEPEVTERYRDIGRKTNSGGSFDAFDDLAPADDPLPALDSFGSQSGIALCSGGANPEVLGQGEEALDLPPIRSPKEATTRSSPYPDGVLGITQFPRDASEAMLGTIKTVSKEDAASAFRASFSDEENNISIMRKSVQEMRHVDSSYYSARTQSSLSETNIFTDASEFRAEGELLPDSEYFPDAQGDEVGYSTTHLKEENQEPKSIVKEGKSSSSLIVPNQVPGSVVESTALETEDFGEFEGIDKQGSYSETFDQEPEHQLTVSNDTELGSSEIVEAFCDFEGQHRAQNYSGFRDIQNQGQHQAQSDDAFGDLGGMNNQAQDQYRTRLK